MRQLLEQIGLTHGEAEVYEALVELGESTAGTIIKKANIASSKVYDVLHKLIQKGLVNFIIKNGVRRYDATPPERLLDFLEQKKKVITNTQNEIKKIIPIIKAKKDLKKEDSKIVVYTGLQGPRIVLKESIDAGKMGAKLCGYGTDEDPYKDYLPADIEEHFRDQKKYNIKWHLLFTKGKWQSRSPGSIIRYLPKGFTMPVRTMIYGNKVAIVDFNKPLTTIIIQKKEIVESYYKQFNFLWRIAEKNK